MTHRLLKQQLKQFNLNESDPPSLEQWQAFVQHIEQSYTAVEQPKYEQLVETANDIIFTADLKGYFTYVNPPAEHLTGYSAKELLGKHFLELMRSDYHEKAQRFYAKQVEERVLNTYFEFPAVVKNGKELWLGQNAQLIMDDDEIIALQAIARDITIRKQTERQLLLQDTALHAAANGIVITDRDGKVIWVNKAFTALTQYESDEAVGKNPRLLKSGQQGPEFYQKMWQTIAAGEIWQDEVVNRRKDGSLYVEEMTITPVRAGGDDITHYIAIKKDVTERKKKEAQLAKSQQSQETLNAILQLSLAESSLDDLLEQALDIILATPWLSVQAKGSIFLTAPDSAELIMNAQRNLGKPLLTKCARVPFGHCLCGQAAASAETIFAGCVDGRHQIQYDDMPGHGHINVPILLDGSVLGVLNLYIEEERQRDEQEIAYLEAIAKTLAGLIQRKRAEDDLAEQRSFLRQVIDIHPSLMFAKDRDGRFTLANQAMADVYGVTVEELIGKTEDQLVSDPDRAAHFLQEDREIMDTLQEKQSPMDISVDEEGGIHRYLTTKRPIIGRDGKANQVLGVVTDITHIIQVEQELQDSEARFRRLSDATVEGVLLHDNGRIIEANAALSKMAGYALTDLVGASVFELIVPQYHQLVQRHMQAEYDQPYEIEAMRKDGSTFHAELLASTLPYEGRTVRVATVRDITERKQAERQIEEALELRNRQLEISQALSNARTETEIINAVVHKAGYYPEAGVSIFMMEPDGKQLTVKARNPLQSGLKPMPLGSKVSLTQMPQLFSPDQSFVTGHVLKDKRASKAMKQMAKNTGMVSWVAFPITAGNEWMGTLMAAGKEEDLFDEQKLAVYHSLAEQSAIALRAARLFEETQRSLERRSRQIRLSTHIAQEIAAASDLPHLYERVVTLIKESFGYYHTQLMRYDPALDVMALIVGYGDIGEQMLTMNHSMPMGVGLIGTAAVTGRSILRSNTADDPYWQANVLLPDTKGEIAVPIKLGDEVLGVLDVQSNQPNALTEDDQLMLEGLCGQIAVAIESTRLQQEMADRLRELNTLQRYMSRDGWQSYRTAKTQLNGFRYDQSGVRPMREQELPLISRSSAEGRNGKTAVKPTPISKQPALENELINRPLVIRGETIGALAVENNPQQPLSDEETEFLNAIAEQVAEALEAARLFEQTQTALTDQERLASELGTVAEVSTAASTILEVDNLLQTVVELVKLRFGLYHAHIYLVNESGDRLVLRAGAGDVGQIMVLEGREIPFDAESLVARTARKRQGFIENDVRKIIDFMPHPLLPDTQSEMAIPLIVGSTLIGVLDLQSDKVGYFTEEAMQVQRTLASQIAVAVQNATMFADQVETSSKLRQLDKLKSEFLASMSHELRTPLNSIIGFADVLLEGLDGDLNERMEQDVRLIRDSGAHLRDLIGDILDMSKIEAGRMELRYEEIDMRQVAQDILATAGPLANEKKLELKLDLGEDVQTIEADRTRIRQVLWNIMGNAIKFTEKGSVTLLMERQQNMVRVSIRDTGIGIKPEDIVTVFEQFRQVDGSLNRSVGGTGLGMPITKKLIELHGGEIGVDSVPGQGSTFWFTLPVQRP